MHIKHIHNYITLSVISTLILSFLTVLCVTNSKYPHNNQKPNSAVIHEDFCCDDCPVCYCELGKKYCELPCGHKFCKDCIDHWAQECKNGVKFDTDTEVDGDNVHIENKAQSKDPECPLCRRPFVWKN